MTKELDFDAKFAETHHFKELPKRRNNVSTFTLNGTQF